MLSCRIFQRGFTRFALLSSVEAYRTRAYGKGGAYLCQRLFSPVCDFWNQLSISPVKLSVEVMKHFPMTFDDYAYLKNHFEDCPECWKERRHIMR